MRFQKKNDLNPSNRSKVMQLLRFGQGYAIDMCTSSQAAKGEILEKWEILG